MRLSSLVTLALVLRHPYHVIRCSWKSLLRRFGLRITYSQFQRPRPSVTHTFGRVCKAGCNYTCDEVMLGLGEVRTLDTTLGLMSAYLENSQLNYLLIFHFPCVFYAFKHILTNGFLQSSHWSVRVAYLAGHGRSAPDNSDAC